MLNICPAYIEPMFHYIEPMFNLYWTYVQPILNLW